MIVTLITDFGLADHFVASLKGVILSYDPRIRLIDVTHDVPPHDIETAAYLLLCCYRDFPAGTVHLAVVDPGVGSGRRPIAVRAGDHHLVGPDNGIFSRVLESAGSSHVRQISRPPMLRREVSATFHGRDVFAPLSAALAAGLPFEQVGPIVDDPILLAPLRNSHRPGGAIQGRILHIDRFGNCVTSFAREDFPDRHWDAYTLRVHDTVIDEAQRHYGAGTGDAPFVIEGSTGYLEISVNGGSSAERIKAKRGDTVLAELRKP